MYIIIMHMYIIIMHTILHLHVLLGIIDRIIF